MKLEDNIILVVRDQIWSPNSDARQAFVVEPGNRKQLERAQAWGKTYKQYALGRGCDQEPLEIYTENRGFKLTILECAGTSSQGGKLSFWNCLIEKGNDIKLIIGIDQNNLLSLIKQSTIVNGTVEEELALVKTSSTAGVLHSGMKEWKDYIQDRETSPVKKTAKWKLGHEYRSITKKSIYLANLYCWLDISTESVKEKNTSTHTFASTTTWVTHTHIKFRDTPIEKYGNYHSMYSYNSLYKAIQSKEVNKISEAFKHAITKMQTSSIKRTYDLCECIPIFDCPDNIVLKFPSREDHGQVLEVDDYRGDLELALSLFRTKIVDLWRQKSLVSPDLVLKAFAYSAYEDSKPSLTEEEKTILLNASARTLHYDFGDGVEYTGRNT